MVEVNTTVLPEDILLTSIPMGFAIVDTGCTTSVIGEECAECMIGFLKQHQLPLPEERFLPPVELKGFSGEATITTITTKGLVWYVKLGTAWGTISTYVIPGKTAFLLDECANPFGEQNTDFRETWYSRDKPQIVICSRRSGSCLKIGVLKKFI